MRASRVCRRAGLLLPLKHYLSDVVDRADLASPAQLTLLCAWLVQVGEPLSHDDDDDDCNQVLTLLCAWLVQIYVSLLAPAAVADGVLPTGGAARYVSRARLEP